MMEIFLRESEGRSRTKRTYSEEELLQTKERLEMILDNTMDPLFVFDSQWRFSCFSKHAQEQLKILGKNPESLIGKVIWEEFAVAPDVEEALRRAMVERAAVAHEHYDAPLGEWVENCIYPTPDGGLAVFQKYVTEGKQAQKKLRRSEAYLTEAQKLSGTGTWVWNPSTSNLFWSPEHYRILGLDPEKVKLTYDLAVEYIHPEDRSLMEQSLEKAVRERSVFET